MSRLALSLLLLGAMAPAARAEGIRSLGVAVSPVGAWAATRIGPGVTAGMAASIDWDYGRDGEWLTMGGHLAASPLFGEGTPMRVRVGPALGPVHPFVGVGASFLLPWGAASGPGLRVGAEVSAGGRFEVSERLFLLGEGRYQTFPVGPELLDPERRQLVSAYLGVGVRL